MFWITGHYESIEKFSEKFDYLKREIIGGYTVDWGSWGGIWTHEEAKDKSSLEVVLVPKKVHNVTWIATKKQSEVNPHITETIACNRDAKEQEVSTDEPEFAYKISDSSTTSDSTDFSVEGGITGRAGYNGLVANGEIELSFKVADSTGHSNSTTKETTKEVKIKHSSQKLKVPGQFMQKVVTKSFTSINNTLYLLAVEIDNDASYVQYRGHKFPFSFGMWFMNTDELNKAFDREYPDKKNYYDVRLINLTNRNWTPNEPNKYPLKFVLINVPWEVKKSYLGKKVLISKPEEIDETICSEGNRRKRFSTSKVHYSMK